ncbi:MAG: hypothetical protein U0457_08410 [Candidatus Sericytochromatia bacterium]
MSSKELVENFLSEVEKGNFHQASTEYLSENFKLDLPIPLPINIGKFQIGMVFDLVKKSIPDFKLNFICTDEAEGVVKGKVKFSGEFKVEFAIPGFPNVIPPTGKEITLPETDIEFKVSEKIDSLALHIPNFQDLVGKFMNNNPLQGMGGNLNDMAKNAGINIPFKF